MHQIVFICLDNTKSNLIQKNNYLQYNKLKEQFTLTRIGTRLSFNI